MISWKGSMRNTDTRHPTSDKERLPRFARQNSSAETRGAGSYCYCEAGRSSYEARVERLGPEGPQRHPLTQARHGDGESRHSSPHFCHGMESSRRSLKTKKSCFICPPSVVYKQRLFEILVEVSLLFTMPIPVSPRHLTRCLNPTSESRLAHRTRADPSTDLH